MEELLPFLAGLAYMAYKIFDNFKKGQEEARSRNPSQPYQFEEPNTYEEWHKEEELYQPEPAPVQYHEPKYERTYKETIAESSYKKEIPKRVELTNPEIPAEEVVKNRRIHQQHHHQLAPTHQTEGAHVEFDFRDAIIKEAILNRPQY